MRSFVRPIIALMAIAMLLASCTASYIDTVSPSDLASIGAASFNTVNGTKILDDDFLLEISDDDIPYLRDHTVVKANDSKNINEFGIFRVESGRADELKELVSSYVANKQSSYRSMNYFPEEVEKIDCATVKVFGNYVVYSFLNEADTEAFYSAIENAIKA